MVARMLGLNVNTVAIPDIEIINRLEKLILVNQSSCNSLITLDTNIEEMAILQQQDAPHTVSTEAPCTRKGTRSRSLSPQRKRDPKVY